MKRTSARLLDDAVRQSHPLSLERMRERLFTFAFRGLVYPQIWEDPVVDLEALQVKTSDRMVAIASGGCNVMSYLTRGPARITALDLNSAHVALNRLKLCALKHLDSQEDFYRFFGEANSPANISTYDERLKQHLDPDTRAYWDGRDLSGRRRIRRFTRGFYKSGLLGHFIGTSHLAARMLGVRPSEIITRTTLEDQRAFFEETLSPLFDRKLVRWILSRPASLYGLGIPPAQYRALVGGHPDGMAAVIKQRLERLACERELKENYFAWQAFARSYPPAGQGDVPPYLSPDNFKTIRENASRVDIRLMSFTGYLEKQDRESLDCYVLLDAQDWMNEHSLNALWREITRTARPGARVIFRTAGHETILPGRVDAELLDRWSYQRDLSEELGAQDRSAIYGGFHLYVARP